MQLTLIRDRFTPVSTCGQLLVDNQFENYTIERSEKDENHPAIPEGSYEVLLVPPGPHLAELFPDYTVFPEVQNVPARSGIFIHPANWAYQLEGCIGPGFPRGENYVSHSKATFERLMTLLQTATDGIHLTITSERT